ncbi:MAG: hypothetical protein Greene041636_981 [Parcubacteria group bacterium Greene0416_36]|nr:MAG: hypothetical protein Greene041636_981 [Parcubacteria group bacterium Greene0416_36]
MVELNTNQLALSMSPKKFGFGQVRTISQDGKAQDLQSVRIGPFIQNKTSANGSNQDELISDGPRHLTSDPSKIGVDIRVRIDTEFVSDRSNPHLFYARPDTNEFSFVKLNQLDDSNFFAATINLGAPGATTNGKSVALIILGNVDFSKPLDQQPIGFFHSRMDLDTRNVTNHPKVNGITLCLTFRGIVTKGVIE